MRGFLLAQIPLTIALSPGRGYRLACDLSLRQYEVTFHDPSTCAPSQPFCRQHPHQMAFYKFS